MAYKPVLLMTPRKNPCVGDAATEPVADIDFLLDLLSGKRDQARQLVTMFIQHTPTSVDKVAHAFREKDWSALKFNVHAIKSYYAYIGNRPMSTLLSQWELALQQSQADFNHPQALHDLEVTNEAVIRRLTRALESGEI